MEYYGQAKITYKLSDTPFKKGGEGSVYDIVGKADYVAKIYHGSVVTAELEAKIKYITNNPPSKSILNQIAWPVDYLNDANGKFVGFVMPKLKIDAELGDLYIYPPKPKKATLSYEQKVIVAINICRVISEIHKAGYVFGDFNPCNIGVNLTTGNVAFLDTDSYHIYDKDTKHTYRCVVCLNGYVAPELIQNCKGADYKTAPLPTFTQETDRFALAIHIFKLLFNGYTPYNGIKDTERSSQASPGVGNVAIERDNYCFKPGNKPLSPAVPSLDAFPEDVRDLFTRAFIGGRYAPTARPAAEEWDKALCSYRSSLVQCKNNPLHHYDGSLTSCPYCEADRQYMIAMNGGAANSSSNSQISFSQPVTVPTVSSGSTPRTSSSGRTSVTGYASGGSAALGGAINRGTKNQNKVGFKKKLKIGIISTLCLLLVVGGILGGVYYKNGMDAINETIELINSVPDSVESYYLYEDVIAEAYSTYSSLSEWQKKKVTNSDKILTIIPQYNEYKVALLRTAAEGVDVNTVSQTTSLKDTVEMYNALNDEQKALLSTPEKAQYENYLKVYQVINDIDAISNDLVNKYNTITSVKRSYLTIDDNFKQLVYNYELINGFESQLEFLNQFTFTAIDEGYSIKVADGVELQGEIVIPSVYNNQDVVKIESNAFAKQRKLTSVIIPNTILQIDSGSFAGCNRLESLTLPFVGESITKGTFTHIFGNSSVPQSLKKVTITLQDKVVDSAFSGCNHIEQIVYEEELDYIGANSFSGCEALSSFNSSEVGTVNLSGAMDKIGNSAFKNCESITHIIFSDEILTIDNYAFSGCKNIEELNLTNRITTIGDYAFQGLKKLTIITVPNNIEVIGQGAFNNCSSLEEITVPFIGRSKEARNISDGWRGTAPARYEQVLGFIFGYKEQIKTGGTGKNTNYSFDNVRYGSVEGAVWQYSYPHNSAGNDHATAKGNIVSVYYYIPTSLKKVIITNQTDVPTAAFNGCTMLTDITFTQGLENQGDCAFQNCTATIHNGTE